MAARVGVNAIPEIKEFSLTPEDKIMVLASDGVWEFLQN
jgi:serine/threonine protein phosphatase PrpC